jgi:hypothetical protein
MSSPNTNWSASTEKYRAKKVPKIVNGKPNENKLSCGADFVINPIPRFIRNNKLTIGNTIRTAFS